MTDRTNALLAAAAAEGRQDPPPPDELARYGHAPVPPSLRCQTCGRLLYLAATVGEPEIAAGTAWRHVPDADLGDDW